jgi:hypothetical protein
MTDIQNCKSLLKGDNIWSGRRKCARKAVTDGFCKQHHPDAAKKRQAEIDEKFKVRQRESLLGYGGPRLLEALRSIAHGASDPKSIAQAAIDALRLKS